MSESHATHSKPASEARRNGGGSRHNSETDNPPSTPCATRSKSDNGTPSRPSSVLNARQTNSTPRLRSRPAPISSLSTPLGRSMSMRMSKKEKRWSMRLDDPRRLRTSTYQDDYQSPEELSLQGLNLETVATTEREAEFDPNAPTTYRESYKWQRQQVSNTPIRSGDKGLLRSTSDETDTPNRTSHNSTARSDRRLDASTSSGSTRTTSNNGQVWEQHSHIHHREHPASPPAIQSPPSACTSSFFKRNSSSGVMVGQSVSSADRKSPASSGEDRVPIKPAVRKGVSVSKPANGNAPSVNGEAVRSPGTPQSYKLAQTNGDRGRKVSHSEDRTPRRMRAYQLQSSTGESPFVYGSDSGSWV